MGGERISSLGENFTPQPNIFFPSAQKSVQPQPRHIQFLTGLIEQEAATIHFTPMFMELAISSYGMAAGQVAY